jgi:hypothetical protein
VLHTSGMATTTRPATTCPACGADITGAYCATCGQRATSLVLSVRTLLRDVLEDQFSVNGTLPRTLLALFFKPGFLTNEYVRLRISPYVPPFRLYLVASVLFFLLASFRTGPPEITVEDRAELDSIRAAVRDSAAARVARGEPPPQRRGITIPPAGENWADSIDVDLPSEWLTRAVRARLQTLGHLPPEEALRRVFRGAYENAPKVMFLLLPFYALLLKVLYIRRKRYYVEHFIFALHVHAFAFILFLVMLPLADVRVIPGVLLLWLLIYFWLALKRVYRQGWLKTTVKWFLLGQTYAIAVVLGLVVAIFAAIFTL